MILVSELAMFSSEWGNFGFRIGEFPVAESRIVRFRSGELLFSESRMLVSESGFVLHLPMSITFVSG